MVAPPSWGWQPDRSPTRQPVDTRSPAGISRTVPGHAALSFLGRRSVADTECRVANELHVVDHLGRNTHLLFRFLIRNPPVVVLRKHKRLRKDLRIVNGHDHLQMIVVDARVAFLDAGVDAVRMAGLVKPRLVTDADGIDHERVITFPMPG